MIQIISGAIVMGYAVAGLHFLRFWHRSHDRLFATFAGAFWLLGIQRLLLAIHPEWNGEYESLYLLRLLAFLMIIWAIIDKNRTSRGR